MRGFDLSGEQDEIRASLAPGDDAALRPGHWRGWVYAVDADTGVSEVEGEIELPDPGTA